MRTCLHCTSVCIVNNYKSLTLANKKCCRLKRTNKTTQRVEMNRHADNIERNAPTQSNRSNKPESLIRKSNQRNKLESPVPELNSCNDTNVLGSPRRDSNSSQQESPRNN